VAAKAQQRREADERRSKRKQTQEEKYAGGLGREVKQMNLGVKRNGTSLGYGDRTITGGELEGKRNVQT